MRRVETAPFWVGVDVIWKILAAGMVFLAAAGYLFYTNAVFAEHGIVAIAEVVDVGGPHERPTARFVTRTDVPYLVL